MNNENDKQQFNQNKNELNNINNEYNSGAYTGIFLNFL